MMKFEFFEHQGASVGVEVSAVARRPGPVYVASLLHDATVRFEAASPDEAFARLKRYVTRPPRRLPGRGRVLVVDDNPACVQIAISLCEHCGHRAVGARDGNEALWWLQAEPFDLILTDLHMPGLGGLAFIQMLRGTVPGREIPIIAITAAGPNGIQALWDAGADRVVRKPYDVKDLMAAIQAMITPGGS